MKNTFAAVLLVATAIFAVKAEAQDLINICGSVCDPPGYGACPNTEEQYFRKVRDRTCSLRDEFKPRFEEWTKMHDAKMAAERAEQERRKEAVRKETQRLGSHREAEARRLVEMREAAERSRPKPKAIQPSTSDQQDLDKPQCRMVTERGTHKVPKDFLSKAIAERAIHHDASTRCKKHPIAGNRAVFSDLSCTSTQGRGVVSGTVQTYWGCSGSFICSAPHEVCDHKPSSGSKQ